MLQKIKKSIDYIASKTSITPKVGLVLGSGLGNFVQSVQIECEIPFSEIPHFPVSGIEGHRGALLFARYNNIAMVIMQGRVHFYEGYSMDEVTYPIRVLKQLGIGTLFLTNAAGGMNSAFSVGDLMLITDHINMMPNPLIGPNIDKLGPRFPDMSQVYDKELFGTCIELADKNGIKVQQGIYLGVTGPTYETPAEYKFFAAIGADAVGMSTIPEVIIARHMGVRCFAMSVITDLGIPGRIEFISHEMVQEAAVAAEPKMTTLLLQLLCSAYPKKN